MIILDLPPQTVQVIEQVAHKNGQSIQDFITLSAYEKALQSFAKPKEEPEKNVSLIEFIEQFDNRTSIGDGLTIQKALRDEWD